MEEIHQLIIQLSTKNDNVALPQLIAVGEPAVEQLIQALENTSERMCRNAIRGLAEIGDARAVIPLIQIMQKRKALSSAATRALGRIGDARAVPPLIEIIGKMSVGSTAVEALSHIGDAAVDPLINLLDNDHWLIRGRAIDALGIIRAPRAIEPLKRCALKDRNDSVRRHAADSLSRIGEPAVDPLVRALRDHHEYIRTRAAEVLGKIGISALPALTPLLADADEAIRTNAKQAVYLIQQGL